MYIAVMHTVASMGWLLCVLQRVWICYSVHCCDAYCGEYGLAVVYMAVVCTVESMDSL